MISAVSRHEDAVERAKAGIRTYLEFFKRHRKLFLILILEQGEIGHDGKKKCCERYMSHIEQMQVFMAEGVKAGVFKKIDPGTLSYGVLGMLNYIIFKWLMSNAEYDIVQDIDTFYDMIFNGILLKEE